MTTTPTTPVSQDTLEANAFLSQTQDVVHDLLG